MSLKSPPNNLQKSSENSHSDRGKTLTRVIDEAPAVISLEITEGGENEHFKINNL